MRRGNHEEETGREEEDEGDNEEWNEREDGEERAILEGEPNIAP